MLFVDWEKASDKVDQAMLVNALWGFNIPEKTIKIIESFYKAPEFRIKDDEGYPEYRRQRAGIRQGCPLSPYLVILLMTVLLHDVYAEMNYKIIGHEPDCVGTRDILYAGDTMTVGTRAREINTILAQIGIKSGKHDLKLSYGK